VSLLCLAHDSVRPWCSPDVGLAARSRPCRSVASRDIALPRSMARWPSLMRRYYKPRIWSRHPDLLFIIAHLFPIRWQEHDPNRTHSSTKRDWRQCLVAFWFCDPGRVAFRHLPAICTSEKVGSIHKRCALSRDGISGYGVASIRKSLKW